jgi:mannose-6-phosphate isomerase class I
METNQIDLERRPFVLRSIDSPKSWGSESWLNSARREAGAIVSNAPGSPALADIIAAHPEVLGEWSRSLFGDELPIFTKFLHADFPPLVHVGFNRAVDRAELTGWLAREQALLRQLLGSLELTSRARFDAFASLYSDWATLQARVRWQSDDTATLAARLAPFTQPEKHGRLVEWLGQLRTNRAQIVDVLNEIDLEREDGNLILTSAGVIHAIFGLSHQTHPLDHTRPALQTLLRQLRRLAQAGGTDSDLHGLIDAAELPQKRALNLAPPKNEGWLPISVNGKLTLVEPQQSSDTTYSLADFYTPFIWDGQRARFRKGDADHGLRSVDLAEQLLGVELSATSIDSLRRVPVLIPEQGQQRAQLFRLVDETDWPFFTAHRLQLDGSTATPATWHGDHGPGVFQQLVVVKGEVELTDANGSVSMLSPSVPAFIPATMQGGYRLSSSGEALILAFSVPGPRGGIVHG